MRRFLKFLVRTIPRIYLIKFSYVFSWVFAAFYKGHKQHCPICDGHFRKFLPYGYAERSSNNRLCPSCLSLERHRLIWLYLKNKTKLFTESMNMLHIAPEQSFYKRFKAIKTLDYFTADLESPLAEYHFDIHDIPFEDNKFDFIMCNHVLEHVDDEFKVTGELFRVLKPEGEAILQAPISKYNKETFEDFSITSPEEREKYFGQEDHVRIYGKNYKNRLESVGFKVDLFDIKMALSIQDIKKYGLNEEEILYIGKK
jgi:SAM-dependent methyltransferase